MTVEERLRDAAKYLERQHPRPCSNGQFIDELLVQAADELHATYQMAGELATALRAGEEK